MVPVYLYNCVNSHNLSSQPELYIFLSVDFFFYPGLPIMASAYDNF